MGVAFHFSQQTKIQKRKTAKQAWFGHLFSNWNTFLKPKLPWISPNENHVQVKLWRRSQTKLLRQVTGLKTWTHPFEQTGNMHLWLWVYYGTDVRLQAVGALQNSSILVICHYVLTFTEEAFDRLNFITAKHKFRSHTQCSSQVAWIIVMACDGGKPILFSGCAALEDCVQH